MSTINLYHGTAACFLDKILKEGITPREGTNRKSNYRGLVESKKDYVYLSSVFPVFYGLNAAIKHNSDLLIFKVLVDTENLFPDEDWIAIKQAGSDRNRTLLRKLTSEANPLEYRQYWQNSLKQMGNVCCRQIAPNQVIAYRVLPQGSHWLDWLGADANPGVMCSNVSIFWGEVAYKLGLLFENDGSKKLDRLFDKHFRIRKKLVSINNWGGTESKQLLKREADIRFAQMKSGAKILNSLCIHESL